MPLVKIRKPLTFSSVATNTKVLVHQVNESVIILYINYTSIKKKKKKMRLYKLAKLKYTLQLVKLVYFIILEINMYDLIIAKTLKK